MAYNSGYRVISACVGQAGLCDETILLEPVQANHAPPHLEEESVWHGDGAEDAVVGHQRAGAEAYVLQHHDRLPNLHLKRPLHQRVAHVHVPASTQK